LEKKQELIVNFQRLPLTLSVYRVINVTSFIAFDINPART